MTRAENERLLVLDEEEKRLVRQMYPTARG
jgi:hypothetical protein